MKESIQKFATTFFDNFSSLLNPVAFFEILLISAFLFFLYKRVILGTQAERIVKGLFFIFTLWLFSKLLILFHLNILGVFLDKIVSIVIFGLVVIFQPELRRFLGYLGQPDFFNKIFFGKKTQAKDEDFVKEISDAIKYLSKNKTGALIVFHNMLGYENLLEIGTRLNANISTELLLTVFHPNTPLHDGAVLINSNKIIAAGILLPLTEDPKLSWQYGTRHRAAIGFSESSDAIVLIVSEETGNISIAQGGEISKIETVEELQDELKGIFGLDDSKGKNKAIKQLNDILTTEINIFSSENSPTKEN